MLKKITSKHTICNILNVCSIKIGSPKLGKNVKGSFLKKPCHNRFLKLTNYPDSVFTGSASVPSSGKLALYCCPFKKLRFIKKKSSVN